LATKQSNPDVLQRPSQKMGHWLKVWNNAVQFTKRERTLQTEKLEAGLGDLQAPKLKTKYHDLVLGSKLQEN